MHNRDIEFEGVFRIQKKAVRIISKLKFRDSCKNSFRELELLILPCLYLLKVTLYCRFKLVQDMDVHQYGTSGRDNFHVRLLTLLSHMKSAISCLHMDTHASVRTVIRLRMEDSDKDALFVGQFGAGVAFPQGRRLQQRKNEVMSRAVSEDSGTRGNPTESFP
ncbi:hypothetical protein J6590_043768 [Homalodisca vitripennis]|nr:hypothetical protein J6590_043768 [Homalodisca vitripennis]